MSSKQQNLRITILGPYGPYTNRLRNIANQVRKRYNFVDTYAVIDRKDFREIQENESQKIYFKKKSYHYLENSNVIIFIFFHNAHNDSMDFEFKHMLDILPHKLNCSVMFLPNNQTPTILEAEAEESKIKVIRIKNYKPDEDIIEYLQGVCDNFLVQKVKEL